MSKSITKIVKYIKKIVISDYDKDNIEPVVYLNIFKANEILYGFKEYDYFLNNEIKSKNWQLGAYFNLKFIPKDVEEYNQEAITIIQRLKVINQYPHKAGHRGVRTSISAANDTNKKLRRLHKQVLIELARNPNGLTGSELSNLTKVSILTIRPRTTELKAQGLIVDSEETKKNENGKSEIVYKLRSMELLKEFDIDV